MLKILKVNYSEKRYDDEEEYDELNWDFENENLESLNELKTFIDGDTEANHVSVNKNEQF